MSKIKIFLSAFFLMFVFSQIVTLTCIDKHLAFALHAEELPSSAAWKEEFTEIASKTGVSMTLSTEELQTLVERCDKLLPVIEGLDETQRKIYLKRLDKMKSLFDFVIESRKEVPK